MIQSDPDLGEIRELNLTYLILAQRLLRSNFAQGMYRLGLDEDAAQLLHDFTLPQIMKLAQANVLLVGFRLNDYHLLSALNHSGLNGELMASQAALMLSNLTPGQIDSPFEPMTTLNNDEFSG